MRLGEPGPPPLIPIDQIKSQAARATVMYRDPRDTDEDEDEDEDEAEFERNANYLWVTIGLSRVR